MGTSAIVTAILGFVASFLADWLRGKRDDAARKEEGRREVIQQNVEQNAADQKKADAARLEVARDSGDLGAMLDRL